MQISQGQYIAHKAVLSARIHETQLAIALVDSDYHYYQVDY